MPSVFDCYENLSKSDDSNFQKNTTTLQVNFFELQFCLIVFSFYSIFNIHDNLLNLLVHDQEFHYL